MPTPPNSITVTALDIIKAAMMEIGALAGGETPSDDDAAWVLQKLQRLIDRYNAREPMVYNVNFLLFTLPLNTQPITIGPGAMFDVNQRPVKIESASVVLNPSSSSSVDIPVNVRDEMWWASQRVKNLTSTYPTDLYYSPDWPTGNLYFWPIPMQANGMRLEMRTVLAEITAYVQSFSMPPAYWDAIVYPLAVSLCPSFERPASAELIRLEAQAIKAIQTNNIASPRGSTGDAGMPGLGRRGDFNYVSGLPNGFGGR
jgi:hypothetical protein